MGTISYKVLYFIILRSTFFNNSIIRMYLRLDASSPSKGWPLAAFSKQSHLRPPFPQSSPQPRPHSPLACVLLWPSQSMHAPGLKTGVLNQANRLQARMQHHAVRQLPQGRDVQLPEGQIKDCGKGHVFYRSTEVSYKETAC